MASQNINPELAVRLGDLREKHGDSVKVEDISAVVESMMATMKGDLSATDIELYSELEALAQYIHAAKADIAALRPDEVKDDYLPTAADELDAIVAATEKATNTIMDATSTIYEACGFQDITGQRTTKVVKALKDIEEKIDALVEAFGSEIEKFKNDNPKADEESGRELTDEDLLEGPQLEEQAQTQEEIDALLATFD